MNDDRNVLGRLLALALLLGAAYGVTSIARGGFACPLGDGARCAMGIPASAQPPAVEGEPPAAPPAAPR